MFVVNEIDPTSGAILMPHLAASESRGGLLSWAVEYCKAAAAPDQAVTLAVSGLNIPGDVVLVVSWLAEGRERRFRIEPLTLFIEA